MPQLDLLVIGIDPVFLRARIAPHRRPLEVLAGQTQVGLLAELRCLAELELEELVDRGIGSGVEAQLAEVVLQPHARSPPSIELLEAIGIELKDRGIVS